MHTLYDFGHEVEKIREAINSIEVKGEHNAALVVYCIDKCNNIIEMLNETAKAALTNEQREGE